MLTLVLCLVALIFGLIGAAIARTRGYSPALGWAVGWTGFAGWMILALLPQRGLGDNNRVGIQPAHAAEERFPRIERSLRVLYPLALGIYLGVFVPMGITGSLIPSFGAWLNSPSADLLGVPAAAAAAMFAAIWVQSLYLLFNDDRLPQKSRGRWALALIILTMLAAVVFVPWRWRVLREQCYQSSQPIA